MILWIANQVQNAKEDKVLYVYVSSNQMFHETCSRKLCVPTEQTNAPPPKTEVNNSTKYIQCLDYDAI